MKLDDFLKCKKVRCVDNDGCNDLTIGKEYEVTRLSLAVHIIDDDDGEYSYQARRFEPVLDSAENPLQNIELTPEFEAVEPKFKVGDKVYYGSEPDVLTILEFDVDGWARMDSWAGFVDSSRLCKATPENYEMLCKLYPHIEFEQPPKPLTGNDLCRAMLDKGWKYVPCFVSDENEWDAVSSCNTDNIISYEDGEFWSNDSYKYAVPFDPKTGQHLTESILND
ncbi:hypothetical protein ACLWP4_001209 [Campylobacter jejuni]